MLHCLRICEHDEYNEIYILMKSRVSYLGNYFLYHYLLRNNMFENDKKIQEMTEEDWKNKLTQEQYEVCRNKGYRNTIFRKVLLFQG